MRNIGYIRVSTKEQANEGYSLSAQKKSIENYSMCALNDDIEILADEGYSAKSNKRPEYQRMIKLIKKRKVNNIVVYKIDRISRNIIDFNDLINLCIDYGVNLISITDNINFNSAVGRCVANIIMSFAQMEREQISERTNFGIKEALEKGVYAIGGSLPLGVSKNSEGYLFYNNDIGIVKEIFKLHKYQYSYEEIKKNINKKYKKDYTVYKIDRIIKNSIYRGYREFKGKKYYFIKPIVKDEDKEIKFKTTKKELNIRKRNIKKHEYLFERFLSKDFNVTTAKKKLSCGKIKEYKYYINKKNPNLKLNEKVIIKKCKNYVEKEKIKYNNISDTYNNRVKNLYIKGIIDEVEAKYYYKKIDNHKESINIISCIDSLKIDCDGCFNIKLKSN